MKPKWNIDELIIAAEAAHRLAKLHIDVIGTRLPAGMVEGAEADVGVLRGDSSTALASLAQQKAATRSIEELCERGAELVASFRGLVRGAYPSDKKLQQSYGVGKKTNVHSVRSVSDSLQTVLVAVESDPTRSREAGVLPADVEEAKATRNALLQADTTQEGKKLSRKQAQAERVKTQLRLEEAVSRIVAAARFALRERPEVAAQFEAVLPTRPQKRSPAGSSQKAIA